MELRIAGTANDSIVDGPGIRYTIFTQGCPHNCKGCHNPQTHDFSGGELVDTDTLLEKAKENPLLDGVTFSGGEPFCQAEALADLGRKLKAAGLNIITYTGYTFEHLYEHRTENGWGSLLEVTDYLIDGPFILEQKDWVIK
ncbi:MAG: radical SAM protein, partial [Ruminococcus sp.]|nr:radical SAM protein [Ruminococcus sp.]